MLPFLRCPVTRSPLTLEVIHYGDHSPDDPRRPIHEGILFAAEDWFFPVIEGIPRLTVEAFLDYENFFHSHLPDYRARRHRLMEKYPGLIAYARKKNKRTKDSFTLEWSLYDYHKDRTWEAGRKEMLLRFLDETDEGRDAIGLKGKLIFDAGCGNGLLDTLIAQQGAIVFAMDLSDSIERAYRQNTHPDAWYLQGDVQFPPVDASLFDIVHCSGVLHHTRSTELSFHCLETCVRPGGKLSVWLYHPRKSFLHQVFNNIRLVTSRLSARQLYLLLLLTAFPISYLWKRAKGNRQNRREMMIGLMDWLGPEFRREHTPDEAASWYAKKSYRAVKITTSDLFGFNITGIKEGSDPAA